MSPAASADPGAQSPRRAAFSAELEQVRLQIEVMMLRVDESLERARRALTAPGTPTAGAAAADDEIDAMHVSLTERCQELVAREGPKASDLRLLLSCLRVVDELERIGDLALRVVRTLGDPSRPVGEPAADVLAVLADEAVERHRLVLRCWAEPAADDLARLLEGSPTAVLCGARLRSAVTNPVEPDGAVDAVRAATIGWALGRTIRHTTVLGHRLAYIETADRAHLAAEVR